ncbi:MAG: phosphoglycolate phosphatase [Inquilinus sp.]|nr:phosphoglycolate phosphatase [Inquilinus sp.]
MTDAPSAALPRAVLFDLDGTLVDSAPGIAEVINHVLVPLGCPPLALAAVREMIGDGAPRLLERALAAHALALPPAEEDILLTRYLALLEASPPGPACLFPGATEVVSALAAEGVALGLCTNKPVAATRSALRALRLDDRFGVVLGGDSLSRRKPDPEPLLAALAELGRTVEGAVMIGDSTADIDAARAAGMASIAVRYGYSRKPVDGLGADLVIDRLSDLAGALRRLRFQRNR